MTRQQRFKYEMFVRVRDFGVANAALFPEASKGGQAFARVLAAVAALDEQQQAHLLGLAEARRIKAATRDAVLDYMKTIAAAARRFTLHEPGKAQAGIVAALAEGLDAVRDLDVIVAIATREQHPSTFAAWTSARRIEGQSAGPAKAPVPAPEASAAVPPAPALPAPTGSPEPAPAEMSVVALEKAS